MLQKWPLVSVVRCSSTLLISVFPDAFDVVHCQVFGLSVHLLPPEKMESFPFCGSMKWKVRAGLMGTPFELRTPPIPGLFVEPSQSPVPGVGTAANKSPSIAKPPAGERTGAIPCGGGEACPVSPSNN